MRGTIAALALISANVVPADAGAVSASAQPLGHCRVISGEKWLDDAGGASTLCDLVEEALTSAVPKARYTAEVRALSPSRLSATLLVNGRKLPEQNFAVMDARLSIESIRRFATSLGEAAKAAAR